ncbi:dephospho-CoA kinase [Mesoaciditoga lauensis]|uniref:dephospho-CoA kinase n=1 Tax=Mesoaciditoga lauensis TaxID=1495039 RepID=UPI00056705B6|nr:dephospho-CoA kinase [Mesoaciditoga lauensis]
MKFIAITGGIGTGKSTVTKFIREKGYVTIDADEVGHEALKEKEIKMLVSKEFEIPLDKNGEINRKKLGKIVFSDRKKLNRLNSILHPQIVKMILDKLRSLSNMEEVFVEAAVLFEMKLDRYADYIIVTDCSDELRMDRIMKREHISRKEAMLRIKTQLSREDFLKRADYVINTSKSLQYTLNQVSILLQLKPWSDKI